MEEMARVRSEHSVCMYAWMMGWEKPLYSNYQISIFKFEEVLKCQQRGFKTMPSKGRPYLHALNQGNIICCQIQRTLQACISRNNEEMMTRLGVLVTDDDEIRVCSQHNTCMAVLTEQMHEERIRNRRVRLWFDDHPPLHTETFLQRKLMHTTCLLRRASRTSRDFHQTETSTTPQKHLHSRNVAQTQISLVHKPHLKHLTRKNWKKGSSPFWMVCQILQRLQKG
jgi:hypothetical protein